MYATVKKGKFIVYLINQYSIKTYGELKAKHHLYLSSTFDG
jgi:hypothetical protein